MNGLQLKERGQQIALFNCGEDWLEQTIDNLRAFCKVRKQIRRPVFRFEEFREIAEERGWPLPASHKAWGSLPRVAIKHGLIVWTGKHVPAESHRTHGHYVKTWRAI